MSEARTGKRFPLALPITIRPKKAARGTIGTTANVSAAGVYIQTSTALEVGAILEFDITLPSKIVGTREDVEIKCKGRVVRMESAGKGTKARRNGIACVIDHYKFVRKK